MVRKLLRGMMSLGIVISCMQVATLTAGAENGNSDVTVKICDREIYFDQPPVIVDGRTMVPMRAIFEELGYSVDWEQSTQKITAIENYTEYYNTVVMYVNNNIIVRNGEEIYSDVAPMIVNGRTLVPVRALSECIGYDVSWDDSTRTVNINNSGGINTGDSLLNAFAAQNGSLYAYYLPDDYDFDGLREAFVITGTRISDDDYGDSELYKDMEVWYISSDGDVQYVDNVLGMGYYTGTVMTSNAKFIAIEASGGGSGSWTKIYGVKYGNTFQPSISGKYGGFAQTNGGYKVVVNDFSKGFHDYVDTELTYDAGSYEFYIK